MSNDLKSRLAPRWRRRPAQGIDLGGGRMVAPEDLLEGHFARLRMPHGPSTDVSVAASPMLTSVIRVAAPTLAPLTEIAEQLAEKLPTIQPADKFRSELLHALEDAHRRRLDGAAATAQSALPRWLIALVGVVAAVGAAGLLLALLSRRAQRPVQPL